MFRVFVGGAASCGSQAPPRTPSRNLTRWLIGAHKRTTCPSAIRVRRHMSALSSSGSSVCSEARCFPLRRLAALVVREDDDVTGIDWEEEDASPDGGVPPPSCVRSTELSPCLRRFRSVSRRLRRTPKWEMC